MKIYKLKSVQPSILGYPFALTQEEMKTYEDFFTNHIGTGKPVVDLWNPTILCDLYQVDIGRILLGGKESWVVNEKAKKVLEPLIESQVEFLPFLTKDNFEERFTQRQRILRKTMINAVSKNIHSEQQYLLNILSVESIDLIDNQSSKFDYSEDKDLIYGVEHLAFHPEKLKDLHIFKIDNPGIYFNRSIFISDSFRKLVEKHELIGLQFIDEREELKGNLIWKLEEKKLPKLKSYYV